MMMMTMMMTTMTMMTMMIGWVVMTMTTMRGWVLVGHVTGASLPRGVASWGLSHLGQGHASVSLNLFHCAWTMPSCHEQHVLALCEGFGHGRERGCGDPVAHQEGHWCSSVHGPHVRRPWSYLWPHEQCCYCHGRVVVWCVVKPWLVLRPRSAMWHHEQCFHCHGQARQHKCWCHNWRGRRGHRGWRRRDQPWVLKGLRVGDHRSRGQSQALHSHLSLHGNHTQRPAWGCWRPHVPTCLAAWPTGSIHVEQATKEGTGLHTRSQAGQWCRLAGNGK